jgi:hypothetical protein
MKLYRITENVVIAGVLLALSVHMVGWPASVHAHQSPGTCNSNRLNVGISKDKTQVQQGDLLTYEVTVSNPNATGAEACDFTNVSIDVTLPAVDGTPTGTVVNVVSGQSYASGTPVTFLTTIPYTVNVNAGVIDVIAKVEASGTLHDAPSDHTASIMKTIGTSVIIPVTPPSGGGGETPVTPTPTLPGLPKTGALSPLSPMH